MTPETFPQYFRKDNRCVKRTGLTDIIEIVIPLPGHRLPLIHTPVTFPDRQRLDKYLIEMELADQAKYTEFLFTFYQASQSNRELLNQFNNKK